MAIWMPANWPRHRSALVPDDKPHNLGITPDFWHCQELYRPGKMNLVTSQPPHSQDKLELPPLSSQSIAMTINYAQARENMVEQQVRPWEVLDPRVLAVIGSTPRELFVDEAHRELAYADLSLPIGHDQFMMKPVIEGRTLQGLLPQAHERVLEVGTGSGYFAACLAQLAASVHSLEIQPALAEAAQTRLAAQGYGNVTVEVADALQWHSDSRFDVVCVTGAVTEVPAHFFDWLSPGGRLFVIHGHSPVMQAEIFTGTVNHPQRQSLFETDLPYLSGAAPVPRFSL